MTDKLKQAIETVKEYLDMDSDVDSEYLNAQRTIINALEAQPNRCDSCIHSEERNGSNCYECVKGMSDNFEAQPTDKCKGCYYNDGETHAECVVCDKEAQPTDMRDATEEERKSVKDYIESISKPTGVKFDEAYEEFEELDFIQPHKKIPCTITVGKPCEDCISILNRIMEYTYGMLTAEKIGLQHLIKSMMDEMSGGEEDGAETR